MTTSTKREAAIAQPVEQKGPQVGLGDQPLHPDSDKPRSHEDFMAMVAESKARVQAMSSEERRALLDLGGPVEGVGQQEAMRILDELEGGQDSDSDSDEDVEAAESGGAKEVRPEATEDKHNSQGKIAREAGGAQDGKEQVAMEMQERRSASLKVVNRI